MKVLSLRPHLRAAYNYPMAFHHESSQIVSTKTIRNNERERKRERERERERERKRGRERERKSRDEKKKKSPSPFLVVSSKAVVRP